MVAFGVLPRLAKKTCSPEQHPKGVPPHAPERLIGESLPVGKHRSSIARRSLARRTSPDSAPGAAPIRPRWLGWRRTCRPPRRCGGVRWALRAPCDFSGFGEKSLRRLVSSGVFGSVQASIFSSRDRTDPKIPPNHQHPWRNPFARKPEQPTATLPRRRAASTIPYSLSPIPFRPWPAASPSTSSTS